MNRFLSLILLLLIVACGEDRNSLAYSPEVDQAVKGAFKERSDNYRFSSARVIDTIYQGELAQLEIRELQNEITAHYAKINQERLTIDIHARSPNPEAFAQADKSSRENINFYRKLIVGAEESIEQLQPLKLSPTVLGYVILHQYSDETTAGQQQLERYVFLSPEFRVLQIHREDRHDIRVAVFDLITP